MMPPRNGSVWPAGGLAGQEASLRDLKWCWIPFPSALSGSGRG
jgi:hypothetical protein